jgi:hypothetical protein
MSMAAALSLARVAAGGPEWVEGGASGALGDAGSLPGTAQSVIGNGSLTTISGELEGTGLQAGGPVDFEDMYVIQIDGPTVFFASTLADDDGFAEFDTALWLFDIDGLGLLGNDFGGTFQGAAVPGDSSGDSRLGNASDDGTSIVINEPGLYLLVITRAPNVPQSGDGDIFMFDVFNEVSGPDGPGGSSPITQWTGDIPEQVEAGGDVPGEYRITFDGSGFALPSGACCFDDGTCSDEAEQSCLDLGGTYQGDGTDCMTVACPLPPSDRRPSAGAKGSLLVFSKVELRWDASGNLIQDTFLSLSNDYPGDVEVQLYLVNGDPPLAADGTERAHPGWNWVDNVITLTGNEPAYFSAATGQPKGVSPFTVLDPGSPPGRPDPEGSTDRVLRGYVLAWAVDELGREIRWNHLSGTGTVVSYADGTSWEYGAWSFAEVSGAAHGMPTNDPDVGHLKLNGLEYARGYELLLLDFYAVGSAAFSGPSLVTIDTDLTLHPLSADLRQETAGPVTTKASFDIWNMNEVKFSGTDRCITCWDQTLLGSYAVPNHFLIQNLQTSKGKARIDGLASQLCNVDVDGDGVDDIVSEASSLLGVSAKLLTFDGGAAGRAASGTTLIGMGFETAEIQYDAQTEPPPEQNGPGAMGPAPATAP